MLSVLGILPRTFRALKARCQTFVIVDIHGQRLGSISSSAIRWASSRSIKVPNQQTLVYQTPRSVDPSMIRNIGIMAHIDAGKTTTTERMLYYGGFMKYIGDVDEGDTVMDYMEQERARGITITSAAISFFWNKHRINLIDTPGHVDFTLEVERSLRVLDGAIAVIDASAGVEAQTLTVWRQANQYNVPRLIYLNKMDKTGANFQASLESITEKLHVSPLVIQLPIGKEKNFLGIVDLITMDKLMWNKPSSNGQKYTQLTLSKDEDDDLWNEAMLARQNLIEQLADVDDSIAEYILNDTDLSLVPVANIQAAIKKAALTQKLVPVLCGSSLKNKGVQPLADAVTLYLPSPNEVHHDFVEHYDGGLCALAFKIVYDKQRGPLTFLRLYSGELKASGSMYNVTQGCSEKFGQLYEVYADEHRMANSVSAGNIIAVAGLKRTVTGDTLVSSQSAANSAIKRYRAHHNLGAESDEHTPVLAGMIIPDPVFFCSVEPQSLAFQKPLEQALTCLSREDPSLRVHTDPDTGQTILSGMGELHLEIIKDRMCKEYKVEADIGPLQIAYKETIIDRVEETFTLDRTIGNKRHVVTLTISVEPSSNSDTPQRHIEIVAKKDSEMPQYIERQYLHALDNGLKSGLSKGPMLGFPVVDTKVQLHSFIKGGGTSVPIVTACMAQCIYQALKKATPVLLEPVMSLEVNTDDDHLSAVLSDLSQRRSQIFEIQARQNMRVVLAKTPVAEMMGYATSMRTLTSGMATVSMEVTNYERLNEHEQRKAIAKITGFSPVSTL